MNEEASMESWMLNNNNNFNNECEMLLKIHHIHSTRFNGITIQKYFPFTFNLLCECEQVKESECILIINTHITHPLYSIFNGIYRCELFEKLFWTNCIAHTLRTHTMNECVLVCVDGINLSDACEILSLMDGLLKTSFF